MEKVSDVIVTEPCDKRTILSPFTKEYRVLFTNAA